MHKNVYFILCDNYKQSKWVMELIEEYGIYNHFPGSRIKNVNDWGNAIDLTNGEKIIFIGKEIEKFLKLKNIKIIEVNDFLYKF